MMKLTIKKGDEKMAMKNELLSWLVRRKESVILGMVKRHLKMTVDATYELQNAVKDWAAGRQTSARAALKRLDQIEMAADEVRRRTLEELAKGELESREREELTDLMTEVDEATDYAREAGRLLSLTLSIRPSKKLADICIDMCRVNLKTASTLKRAIESLGGDPSGVLKMCSEVETLEEEVDELHHECRREILGMTGGAGTVVMFNEFTEALESVADRFEDTADIVRRIAVR